MTALTADVLYGRLLATGGEAGCLRWADGCVEPLPLARWVGPADAHDDELLAHAEPPVLDLGCGPGRHLAALRASGRFALGVDLSPVAVGLARRRGAAAIAGNAFGEVPWAGRWRTVLLLDGNVGIGGAPEVLLRRARELLAPGGAVLVELEPPGSPTLSTRARIEAHGAVSKWFGWARVGVDGIDALAAAAGLELLALERTGVRWLARLQRP